MPGAAPSTVWDRWSQWLLRGREGGDQALRQRFLAEILLPVRDQVLDRGRIEKGEVVLDVGAGDGLIAFGALDRVGSTGRVIFSDVSPDLLQKCRSLATELNLSDRCSFVECPADNLTGVADMSVDVVTTRSVLIYVDNKRKCFRGVLSSAGATRSHLNLGPHQQTDLPRACKRVVWLRHLSRSRPCRQDQEHPHQPHRHSRRNDGLRRTRHIYSRGGGRLRGTSP